MSLEKKGFLAFLLVLICGVGYALWRAWRTSEDSAYASCLASVMSNLNSQLERSAVDLSKIDLAADGSWKFLSDSEAEAILSQTKGGDCARTKDIRFDLFGKRINVALRHSNDRLKVVLWSNGEDGVSGTEDDISAPYGMKYENGNFRSIY